MTASSLLQDLQAVPCHALTETNVEAVAFDGGRLWLECIDRDADKIAVLKEELREAIAESVSRDEELSATNAELDRVSDAEWIAADRAEEVDRIRERADQWAARCAEMDTELQAMRKRKGVEPGVCAHSREIWALLWYIANNKGQYADEAGRLVRKIGNIK